MNERCKRVTTERVFTPIAGEEAMSASPRAKLDVPPEWAAAAAEIFERGRATILVIGGSGAGKTSFCRYLSEALLQQQAEVAVVDADIGQAILGPPATVTLGYPSLPVDFTTAPPAGYFFVGSTSPMGRLLPLVVGAVSLAREARAPFIIVDTTGFIHASGRVLKNYKIEAMRPDVVVALERRNELAPIRMANRHVPIIRLKPSRAAHAKEDDEKFEVRAGAYARHFAGAVRMELALDALIFQRTLLFSGRPVAQEGAVHAERTAEGLLAVGAPVGAPADTKVMPAGFEKNLLCGVADETGRCRGLGIIETIDFAKRAIALITPVESEQVRIIQFGDQYVKPDGSELGQVKWGW